MLAFTALALSAVAAPSVAANWWNPKPRTVIGGAYVNVHQKGALGNGVHDDTAAIQAAVDSLPTSGGTVFIPAGHYMVNATKPIKLRSHTRLKLDPAATLEVIPTSAGRYMVIQIYNATDVRVVGGNLVGDRAKHKGTTGEWGYGINVTASKNVVLKNINLSNFWGDGIWVGAKDVGREHVRSDYVTINGIVSSNNRRQGMSIGPAQHVYIVNSTFQNTNGTLPEAGVDIEPMSEGLTNTIRLENNKFIGNNGNGIEMHAHISDIAIVGNTMQGNRGFGVLGVSAPGVVVTGNTMTENGLAGVRPSGKSHDWSITGNTLKYNSTRYMSATKNGGALSRDLQFGANTYNIKVSNNIFSNAKYNTYTR
ncbi:right-handed parallel beta-helix repeat-containing protein [Frateuria sp. MAH-13]|uniref:Right-handed parallel beta-helix repeat-containing protein n=1 Tax=Frateuria flava TaxID=2821489 RepID=A0ABS4DI82_9GAMM|nr:right-handed parallel beta-helix repeat-containing protein [Frateuria flava]MBP1472749.1 right-handed parallel beta-helix repeat-containing protein [Frateuria flava]